MKKLFKFSLHRFARPNMSVKKLKNFIICINPASEGIPFPDHLETFYVKASKIDRALSKFLTRIRDCEDVVGVTKLLCQLINEPGFEFIAEDDFCEMSDDAAEILIEEPSVEECRQFLSDYKDQLVEYLKIDHSRANQEIANSPGGGELQRLNPEQTTSFCIAEFKFL
jgi:hypothetical protein